MAKFNEMEMKAQHENLLKKFYTQDLLADTGYDFTECCTGVLIVYQPYYIHFLETEEDEDFFNVLLQRLIDTIGKKYHEDIWVLFETDESPTKLFNHWYLKAVPPNKSNCEIKSFSHFEKIELLHEAMLTFSNDLTELENFIESGKKNQSAIPGLLEAKSIELLPSDEDLKSVLGPETQTLKEYWEFLNPPDILLEDELCWPVKPNLDY